MTDDRLEVRVRALEVAHAKLNTGLEYHLIQCGQRSAALLKLGFVILVAVMAVLGFLVKEQLYRGGA